MKNVRTESGPFPERPHYELQEIERICLDALLGAGLFPDTPEPIRIDRFVEKHFRLSVAYEQLPDGILGYTEFGPEGVDAIVVTSSLDDEGGEVAERRIRTTLAHEAGHGLLHTHLFALNQHQSSMFDTPKDKPQVMCRDEHVARPSVAGYDGRWWEWQANQAIGALLLPKRLVRKAVEDYCVASPGLGLPSMPAKNRSSAIDQISRIFDVNKVVARIRINQLFGSTESRQSMI